MEQGLGVKTPEADLGWNPSSATCVWCGLERMTCAVPKLIILAHGSTQYMAVLGGGCT